MLILHAYAVPQSPPWAIAWLKQKCMLGRWHCCSLTICPDQTWLSDPASHAQPSGKISWNHHFISVCLFDSRAFELCLPRTALTQEVESREFKETKASAGPDREQSGREEDRAGVVREGKWALLNRASFLLLFVFEAWVFFFLFLPAFRKAGCVSLH